MIGDELLDAQVQRAIMGEVAGAADPDECRAVAERIGGVDLDRWHDEWRAAADAALVDGEAALAGGHPDAARAAFLRASTSFRTAGVMLYGAPADGRLVAANRDQAHAFRRAVALLPQPPEIVELPYDDTTLPGYWFEPAGAAAPGPVIVLTGGYDGTAEELYSFTGAAALEHGYRVLCFDGPGQGAALLQQGLVLRPDWEHVIGQVLDWVIAQPGTDPDRIALVGLSLGGHLAPRAAGWALRRGQLVHGVGSPIDYLADLAPYTLAGRAGSITCPTFVNNAEDDDIGASAPELVAALTAPHGRHLHPSRRRRRPLRGQQPPRLPRPPLRLARPPPPPHPARGAGPGTGLPEVAVAAGRGDLHDHRPGAAGVLDELGLGPQAVSSDGVVVGHHLPGPASTGAWP